MIVTEEGVRFRREATGWRCVEYPDLLMLRDEVRPTGGERKKPGVWPGSWMHNIGR